MIARVTYRTPCLVLAQNLATGLGQSCPFRPRCCNWVGGQIWFSCESNTTISTLLYYIPLFWMIKYDNQYHTPHTSPSPISN